MASQTGTVRRIDGDIAYIAVDNSSACSACAKRSGCGIGALDGPGRGRLIALTAPPDLQAGDAVTVTAEDANLLPAALIGYVLPTFLLIAGAVAAGHAGGEPAAVAGAAAGLAGGLLLQRLLLRRHPALTPQLQVVRKA